MVRRLPRASMEVALAGAVAQLEVRPELAEVVVEESLEVVEESPGVVVV